MQYFTKRELIIEWHPHGTKAVEHETVIPAGHPVESARAGTGELFFRCGPVGVVDRSTSPSEYHDAEHYGIPIPKDAVDTFDECPACGKLCRLSEGKIGAHGTLGESCPGSE